MAKHLHSPPPTKSHVLVKALGLSALGAGLLVGGPGTLAGWHVETPLASEVITAGSLSLEVSDRVWVLNGMTVEEADQETLLLSPGDVLTLTAAVTPVIQGSNIVAKLGVTGMESSGSLIDSGVATADWSVNGDAGGEMPDLTEADNGNPVPIALTVTMAPVGDPIYEEDGTIGQYGSLELESVTAALTQTS